MESRELAALVDLIRIIADADGKITPGESKTVDGIATEVGDEVFWRMFQESAFRAAREINLEETAAAVEDPSTRSQFLQWLSELAESDGLRKVEHETLTKIRRLWTDR